MEKARGSSEEALQAAYEMASDLHESGVMDDLTMAKINVMRFPAEKKFSAAEVRQIRASTKMSQSMFANFLNVTKSSVVKWESGIRNPRNSSVRILQFLSDNGTDNLVTRLRDMLSTLMDHPKA